MALNGIGRYVLCVIKLELLHTSFEKVAQPERNRTNKDDFFVSHNFCRPNIILLLSFFPMCVYNVSNKRSLTFISVLILFHLHFLTL